MTPAGLLASLRSAGLTVEARADGLALSPAGLLTDDLRAAVRQHKPALLELLRVERLLPTLDGYLPDFTSGPVQLVEVEVVTLDGMSVALPLGVWDRLCADIDAWNREARLRHGRCGCPGGKGTDLVRVPFKGGGGWHVMERCLACQGNARGQGVWVQKAEWPDRIEELPLIKQSDNIQLNLF